MGERLFARVADLNENISFTYATNFMRLKSNIYMSSFSRRMNPTFRMVRACIYSARYVKYSTLPSEAVIFTEDDRMVVCWHPEKQFPYECSLPLPKEQPDNSVLCIGEKDIADVFRKKKQNEIVHELAKITYTTKHRWYPRSRDKKAKQTEPDRPYL